MIDRDTWLKAQSTEQRRLEERQVKVIQIIVFMSLIIGGGMAILMPFTGEWYWFLYSLLWIVFQFSYGDRVASWACKFMGD